MFTQDQARSVIGSTLYGSGNEKIGKIGQIFVDDETGRPEWVTVHTGLFGTHESFVPVADGTVSDDGLTVPFGKDQIKDAPNVDPEGGHLSESEEEQLYSYYGLSRSGVRGEGYESGLAAGTTSGVTTGTTTTDSSFDSATTGTTTASGTTAYETAGDASYAGDAARAETAATTSAAGTTGTTGYDTSGPTTDDAMTRSEEHLRAGVETVQAGRARLRKWVETEQQTVTVPVTTEHARLVTEPVDASNIDQATSGPDISEEEHEVVLTTQRPVVTTETVPVERVRLETESETHEETVSGEVRKERIDLDEGTETRATGGTTAGTDDLR
ncbi:PRC-barrel domain protein [Motilibacter peucedani]|uniref:PRC-barrel domain protein n=1 Tax=Motilibacter peucedani TaxID=598650 RepID=A0A420XPY5_9ACTN|nr:PRC and DUF2382 domain-containing protein [Motilibacter peucedani]RKS75296.1 PRC-barrel domain protein [Motilibacter peucedani]